MVPGQETQILIKMPSSSSFGLKIRFWSLLRLKIVNKFWIAEFGD